MYKYDKMFMDFADRTAKESNCVKYSIGCVIVKDNRILSHGYNGTVAGFINCSDKFKNHDMTNKENRLIHREWSAAFEVHAEMNGLMYAAKSGLSVDGATMYVTHKPCNGCMKHIIPAGIKRIVYKHDYDDPNPHNDINKLLTFIKLEKFK